MAKRGGQEGNNNALKNKPWRDALAWAVDNHPKSKVEKAQILRDIALNLLDQALKGDQSAIKEIGDRLDGKPTQAIEGDFNHNIVADSFAQAMAKAMNE